MHLFEEKNPRKLENDLKWRISEFKAKIVIAKPYFFKYI